MESKGFFPSFYIHLFYIVKKIVDILKINKIVKNASFAARIFAHSAVILS